MSHTPGPWKFGLGCPSAGFILYGSDGFVIARREVEETTDRNEEMVANARLIAAAPELYGALEELRDKVWRIIDLHRDSEARAEANMALERARSALAQARGGDRQ